MIELLIRFSEQIFDETNKFDTIQECDDPEKNCATASCSDDKADNDNDGALNDIAPIGVTLNCRTSPRNQGQHNAIRRTSSTSSAAVTPQSLITSVACSLVSNNSSFIVTNNSQTTQQQQQQQQQQTQQQQTQLSTSRSAFTFE